ncbi:MAG TPA: hypothetical protein VKV24_06125 [Casimicrobiaceae bacterium]|nr:hypothetical protein [Casimicrobiaceae bacterium]
MILSRFALATLLVLPSAATRADIYVCTGKSGMPVYQNFSCELDSIGASGPKTTTQPQPPAHAAKSSAGVMPVAANTATARGHDASGEPRIGMTADEVKAIWGEPTSTYSDELVDGRVEIWNYDGSRSVHFDLQGRAVAIERNSNGR